jgi:hypothetical protein
MVPGNLVKNLRLWKTFVGKTYSSVGKRVLPPQGGDRQICSDKEDSDCNDSDGEHSSRSGNGNNRGDNLETKVAVVATWKRKEQ